MTPETITAVDALPQIESRLEAALNDLETVHKAFIAHNKDDFGMQLSAFEAQEKIETVLHYIKEIAHKED